jgi:hypothetical protein
MYEAVIFENVTVAQQVKKSLAIYATRHYRDHKWTPLDHIQEN